MTSLSDKIELVSVQLTTKLGATYTFPDMELPQLEAMCPFMQDGVPEGNSGQLCMVNASVAVLNVPLRIIKTICIGKKGTGVWEEWWKAPEREDECFPV